MTKKELIERVNEACQNSNIYFTLTTVCSSITTFGALILLGEIANPEESNSLISGIATAVTFYSTIISGVGLKNYLHWKKEYKNTEEQLKLL